MKEDRARFCLLSSLIPHPFFESLIPPKSANFEASASKVAMPGVGDSRLPDSDVSFGSAEVLRR
jgi:hypothetical protein